MTPAAEWPTLVNGIPADAVSIANRGLAYGDGVFETMLLHAGEVPLLERHMERLALGCDRLGLNPNLGELVTGIESLSGALADRDWCVAKLMLTRQAGGRGYRPATTDCDVIITTAAAEAPWASSYWREGARAALLAATCVPNPRLAGIKHLNRLEQVLAAAEASERGLDEGVLGDGAGHIVGCTSANLFYRCDNRLIQVHHPECGVDGTMAGHIGMLSRSAGLGTVEKRITRASEMDAATEMFCCNAIRGIWPIVEFDGRKLEIGAATRTLQARLQSELTL